MQPSQAVFGRSIWVCMSAWFATFGPTKPRLGVTLDTRATANSFHSELVAAK